MTIKEIADKYEVPYGVAFEATMGIKPYSSMRRDKEYPEKEVVHNIKEILEQRITHREQYVAEAKRILAYVKWREMQ